MRLIDISLEPEKIHPSPLKWAGGKSQHLDRILKHIGTPKNFFEPMCGSAVVARNVPAKRIHINDANSDLMAFYEALEGSCELMMECARDLFAECNTKEWYRIYRSKLNQFHYLPPTNDQKFMLAATFLYLNKHCYNGLCRYNKSGEFNVPYGKRPGEKVYFPEEELLDYAAWLKDNKVSIFNADYLTIMALAGPGDVIYLDPPFIGTSKTSNFTGYTGKPFGMEDQQALALAATAAVVRGAKVIVSNRDCEAARELYVGATIESFMASNNIGCKSRDKAVEILAIYEETK